MSKAHRGNPLRSEGFLRGTCPITGRSGVKLIYDHNDEEGNTIKVSKAAHAKFKNIKKEKARSQKEETPAATPAPVENTEKPSPEAKTEEPAKTEETAKAAEKIAEKTEESAKTEETAKTEEPAKAETTDETKESSEDSK